MARSPFPACGGGLVEVLFSGGIGDGVVQRARGFMVDANATKGISEESKNKEGENGQEDF